MLSQKKTNRIFKRGQMTQKAAATGNRTAEKVSAGSSTKSTRQGGKKPIIPNTLQGYLSSISRYKLLSKDEERQLFENLHERGDSQAFQAIVTSNLRLVVKIALDYRRLWMQNLLDLIQEGNIGLQRIYPEDPKTLADIGSQHGISRERVRQIQNDLISKMKDFFMNTLSDYATYAGGGLAD